LGPSGAVDRDLATAGLEGEVVLLPRRVRRELRLVAEVCGHPLRVGHGAGPVAEPGADRGAAGARRRRQLTVAQRLRPRDRLTELLQRPIEMNGVALPATAIDDRL